jgi:hypothetical protein
MRRYLHRSTECQPTLSRYDCLPPRLRPRLRRHRVEAARLALPLRPGRLLDQGQEPGGSSCEAGNRRRLGLGDERLHPKRMEEAMGFTAIVAMGLVLLAGYGILRIGISIGVKRATKNVVVGFLMKAQLSEVTHEGRELVVELADHDTWYNLFGPEFSLKGRRKENRTREIGGTLWELAFHESQGRTS